MSTEVPTVGHMLREAGYYTAYKGKWHLTKEFETVNSLGTPQRTFTRLNALIDAEVGEDAGQMLPGGIDGGWVVTDAV